MSRNIQLDNTIRSIRTKAQAKQWGDDVRVEISESHDDNLVSTCTMTEFLEYGAALRMANNAYEKGYPSITFSVKKNDNCLYGKEVSNEVEAAAVPQKMELYPNKEGTYTQNIPHEVANEKLSGLIEKHKVESEKNIAIQEKVHEKALSDLSFLQQIKEKNAQLETKEKELNQWKSRAISRKKEIELANLEKVKMKATIDALSPIKAIKEMVETITKTNPAILPTVLSGVLSGKMGDLFQAQAEMMSGLGGTGNNTKEVYPPEIQYILDYLVNLHNEGIHSFQKLYEILSAIIELGNTRFQYHLMVHKICEEGRESELKHFFLNKNQEPINEIVTDVESYEEGNHD